MASLPTVPTSREVLTSLINSISQTRILPVYPGSSRTALGNQFSHLPPSIRPLLTTLHVLFPTLLLPALDLLDRSLITKVLNVSDEETTPAGPASQDSATHEVGGSPRQLELCPSQATFYLVRSAASTSRRTFNAFASSTPYIVRLAAWSCSCANFAFDAYPRGTEDGEIEILEAGAGEQESVGHREDMRMLEFGGLSLDGLGPRSGGVPCCKHLLACFLADTWHGVLGSHVVQKRASKEEIVGLVANS